MVQEVSKTCCAFAKRALKAGWQRDAVVNAGRSTQLWSTPVQPGDHRGRGNHGSGVKETCGEQKCAPKNERSNGNVEQLGLSRSGRVRAGWRGWPASRRPGCAEGAAILRWRSRSCRFPERRRGGAPPASPCCRRAPARLLLRHRCRCGPLCCQRRLPSLLLLLRLLQGQRRRRCARWQTAAARLLAAGCRLGRSRGRWGRAAQKRRVCASRGVLVAAVGVAQGTGWWQCRVRGRLLLGQVGGEQQLSRPA